MGTGANLFPPVLIYDPAAIQRLFVHDTFPWRLSQRDYGNHHVVPVASHPFIAKHARTGRDAQNGLGGFNGEEPY